MIAAQVCCHSNKPSSISQFSLAAGLEGFTPREKKMNNTQQTINSSYPTKAEFINCFIIYQNIFKHLNEKIGVKLS